MSALDDYLCVHQSTCASWLSLEAGKCDCGLNEAIDKLSDLRTALEEAKVVIDKTETELLCVLAGKSPMDNVLSILRDYLFANPKEEK